MTVKPNGKRKRFATVLALGGLLAVVMGLVYLFLTPKMYRASARVQVGKRGWTKGNQSEAAYDPKILLPGECQLIRSGKILDPVIEHLDLNKLWGQRYNHGKNLTPEQSRARLEAMAAIAPARRAGLIQIQITSEDAAEPAGIANEIARVYREYWQVQRDTESRERIDALKKELYEENAKVDAAQAALDKSNQEIREKQATNTVQLYDPSTYQLLQAKRIGLETEYVRQKSVLDQLNGLDRTKLTQVLSVMDENTNSVLTASLSQLIGAEAELHSVQSEQGDASPEARKAKLVVERLKGTVDGAVDGIMAAKQENLVSLKASLDDWNQKLKNASTNSALLASNDPAVRQASRNLENLKQERDALQDRMEMQDKLEALMPVTTSAEIVDLAERPPGPYTPDGKTGINTVFAGGLAAVAGLLLLLYTPKARPAPAIIRAIRR